jgi:hypothetical protein
MKRYDAVWETENQVLVYGHHEPKLLPGESIASVGVGVTPYGPYFYYLINKPNPQEALRLHGLEMMRSRKIDEYAR